MYLGIDYGLSHIGLATSEGSFATPQETLHTKKVTMALELLKKKIKEWGIKTIVLGLSEGQSKARSLSFGRLLKDETGLEVAYVDETLSSKEAQAMSKSKRHEEHSLSAAIILQRFLDNLSDEKTTDLSYTT